MNLEIGTEAAQFPEKEYIDGIFVAVYRAYRYQCGKATMMKTGTGIFFTSPTQYLPFRVGFHLLFFADVFLNYLRPLASSSNWSRHSTLPLCILFASRGSDRSLSGIRYQRGHGILTSRQFTISQSGWLSVLLVQRREGGCTNTY